MPLRDPHWPRSEASSLALPLEPAERTSQSTSEDEAEIPTQSFDVMVTTLSEEPRWSEKMLASRHCASHHLSQDNRCRQVNVSLAQRRGSRLASYGVLHAQCAWCGCRFNGKPRCSAKARVQVSKATCWLTGAWRCAHAQLGCRLASKVGRRLVGV